MAHIDDDPPDGEMTAEEGMLAASLSPELIESIDASLLSFAANYNRKVARIVLSVMADKKLHVPGLSELFYRDRVKILVAKGLLIAEGNLEYMRYSEVRLPK